MDLHKRTSTLVVKTKDGKLINESRITTDPAQVTEYLREYKGASLALEPVSQWYFYADLIESLDIDVHLAHAKDVKAIAHARIKTDSIDAGVLCDLLRADLLPEAYHAPQHVRTWKEKVRYRMSLVNIRTQAKNKIWAILFKNAIRPPYENMYTQKGRAWLRALELEGAFGTGIRRYLDLIEHLDRMIQEATDEIEESVKEYEGTHLLTTIPGISYITALTIMSEIGEISRFPSGKKLAGYAGLVPSTMHREIQFVMDVSQGWDPSGCSGHSLKQLITKRVPHRALGGTIEG